MDKPVVAKRMPYPLEIQAGETVHWCSCGRSATQPFCDGSHQGTHFQPEPYTASRTRIVFFCGCKHSKKGMICDGEHAKLKS